MGLLVEGKWVDRWYDTKESGGKFVRQDAKWRDWVAADGKPAEGRTRGFKAEPGRYHLYVSLACPWAHRTLIFRKLKKLEDIISVSVVHHYMGKDGWTFLDEDGATVMELDVERRRRFGRACCDSSNAPRLARQGGHCSDHRGCARRCNHDEQTPWN